MFCVLGWGAVYSWRISFGLVWKFRISLYRRTIVYFGHISGLYISFCLDYSTVILKAAICVDWICSFSIVGYCILKLSRCTFSCSVVVSGDNLDTNIGLLLSTADMLKFAFVFVPNIVVWFLFSFLCDCSEICFLLFGGRRSFSMWITDSITSL